VSRDSLIAQLAAVEQAGDFLHIIPVSAIKSDGIDALRDLLVSLMPSSPCMYTQDMLSDVDTETHLAELIREAALEEVRDELPHSIAVSIEEVVERDNSDVMDIRAVILVERQSQKGIVIGVRGAKIKTISTNARHEIEKYLGRHVFLDTYVKVAKDWQSDPKALRRLGL
jgi:GTP-binding protein Era